jgi:hypothetical protein
VFYSKLKILYRDKITCPFAILSLIETIRDSREDLEEANTAKPPKQWVGSLIRTLMSLSSEVLKVVKKHQNIVTLKTGGNVGLLTHHLKLLKAIYQVDSYVITLDKNTANLPEVVTIALRSSCAFWYQKLITTAVAAVEGNQKVVVTIAAVRGMVNFLTRAQSQLSPLFDEYVLHSVWSMSCACHMHVTCMSCAFPLYTVWMWDLVQYCVYSCIYGVRMYSMHVYICTFKYVHMFQVRTMKACVCIHTVCICMCVYIRMCVI